MKWPISNVVSSMPGMPSSHGSSPVARDHRRVVGDVVVVGRGRDLEALGGARSSRAASIGTPLSVDGCGVDVEVAGDPAVGRERARAAARCSAANAPGVERDRSRVVTSYSGPRDTTRS